MNNPWILCIAGIVFCVTGVYFFFKNVYEENQSVSWPVIIMIMGVLLIAAGTAKFFKLID
jgi:di/tricarboxylate transporter